MFAQKQFTVLIPTSQRTASTESYVQRGEGEQKRKMVRKMLTKVKQMMMGNGQSQMSQKIGQLVSSSAKSLHTSVKHISRMIWEHKNSFPATCDFLCMKRNLQANKLILISQAGSYAHCSCEVPRVQSTPFEGHYFLWSLKPSLLGSSKRGLQHEGH